MPGGAAAQTSPWYLGLAQNVGRESNLLRLTVEQPAPDGYSKADTVSSTSLLGGFDQRLGRQRAYANLSVRNNRYSRNPIFDNTGYSAVTGLDWQTVNRLSGSLSASANRNLQRFDTGEIGFQRVRNLERISTVNATASLGLVTQYTLEATAGRRQVRNSLQDPSVQAREFTQDNASLGLRWRPSSGAILGIGLLAAQGRYPKFRLLADGSYDADRFKRQDVELRGTLQPSGASVFEARLSSGRTRYDLNEQRNFDGLTGSVAWRWQPTGKLRVNTVFTRDTGQDSYATSVFNVPTTTDYSRITNVLRGQVFYDATAKLQFNVALDLYSRTIVRTTPNPFLPLDASGKERTPILALGLRWTPLRYALVGCDWSRERRRTSGPITADLDASAFSCFAQATLQ
ncbi:MAG: hypothetical protein Q8K45_02400 [Rubrivivax sp.]|nr:hypothetical protein [Rubrivivax sp.]